MKRVHEHRSRTLIGLWLCAVLLAATTGCAASEQGGRAANTGPQEAPSVRHPGPIPDFRAVQSKQTSIEQAEKALGRKIKAPTKTKGRSLAGIYVFDDDTYPDGSPVPDSDKSATLDYGDYLVRFFIVRSVADAEGWIDGMFGGYLRDDPRRQSSLVREVDVSGHPGCAQQEGEEPILTDSSGNVVRYGRRVGGSSVTWATGTTVIRVSSESLSADELLEIALSVNY